MKNRNRIRAIAILSAMLLLLTLLAAACGQPSGTPPASTPGTDTEAPSNSAPAPDAASEEPLTVVFAQNADPTNIDPHKVCGDHGANIHRQITEPLTKFDENWVLQPWLAESWENPSDTEWIFHLKEGIFFTDGESFNAEAVVYNLDRGASTEFPRQAMEYRDVYDHSEAVDEYTVKVYLTAPCAIFPQYMSDMEVLSPAYAEKVGEEGSNSDICGTGPYILESWVPDQQITLVKNENYWRGEPEVDTFIVKNIPEESTMIAELMNGTVDVVSNISFEYKDMLEGSSIAHTAAKLERRVLYIGFNTTSWTPNPQLLDVRVRQAINYAVDRQALIDNIMGGYGKKLASFWREDFVPYDASLESYYDYNPEKARELLAEAGYADGFDITIQSHTGTTSKQHEICQAVAKYLEDVGIRCTVEPVEYNTMRGIIINGQSQEKTAGMFCWSWAGKPGLTDSWLTGIVKSDGMSSYNCIEGYDELCDQILAIGDPEDRADLYMEIQKKLIEDPPYLYQWQAEAIYGVSTRIDWEPNAFMYIEAFDMHAAK